GRLPHARPVVGGPRSRRRRLVAALEDRQSRLTTTLPHASSSMAGHRDPREVGMTRRTRLLAASLSVLVLAPVAATAGPPLVCFPIDIGGAKSLPWGSGHGWNVARADYDRGHLVTDTLALLGPSTPVLVRMETLRRATIYATSDASVARELLTRVEERAREDKATGRAGALALFDTGYLIEVYKQAR